MAQKLTKKEALMAIITALRDDNNEVLVETVDSKFSGVSWRASVDKEESFIPAKHEKYGNRLHAKSIKVGKDITINRDKDNRFLVRTEKGEVEFDYWKDNDLDIVLMAVLNKYENGLKGNFMQPVYEAKDNDLVANAKDERTSKVSKYENAIKQLEGMGIDSENMKKKMMEKYFEYSME